MGERIISDLDRHIAAKIRQRRVMVGKTQFQVSKELKVTYQQQHKYETGVNRVSASRLYHLAKALNTNIAYFFEDIENYSGPVESVENERMLLEFYMIYPKLSHQRKETLLNIARTLAGEVNA